MKNIIRDHLLFVTCQPNPWDREPFFTRKMHRYQKQLFPINCRNVNTTQYCSIEFRPLRNVTIYSYTLSPRGTLGNLLTYT